MNEMNLPMALLDFLPVILCGAVVFIFMKDFYPRMKASQYAFFSAGSIMLVAGGFLKAVWKLIYVVKNCDIVQFSEQFFPMQAMAFIFLAIGTFGMIISNPALLDRKMYSAAAVTVVTSHTPYIIVMAVGMIAWYISLIAVAVKLKKKSAVVLTIIAMVGMIAQSRMGTIFDSAKGIMHWLAESTNTIAHVFLLFAALSIHKIIKEEDYIVEREENTI